MTATLTWTLFAKNIARKANEQTKWARKHGCRLQGGVWADDAAKYTAYCKDSYKPRKTINAEDVQREKLLQACREHEQLCERYADLTAEQRRRNKIMRCGRSEPEWTASPEQFKKACRLERASADSP
jgi:hypothetical protein